ncbi:MAG: BatD family protein [Candidatus Zixiibacteriota bacterium]
MKRTLLLQVWVIFLLLAASGRATSEDEETFQEAKIELSASLERQQFPQNETTTLTVTLKWVGSQDAFEIELLSPPSVDNLRIISSSSSVETKLDEGTQVTLRKYEFALRGESQGVATIGGVQVNYRNAQTGESSFLETQPIQLEITPPTSPKGLKFGVLPLIVVIAIVGVISIFLINRAVVSKRQSMAVSTLEVSPPTLEERLLKELSEIESGLGNHPSEEFYGGVRSITLDFLREKLELAGRSSTTADVVAELEQKQLPQGVSESLKKVLETCDQVRFGFKESSQEEKKEILSLLREVLEPEG